MAASTSTTTTSSATALHHYAGLNFRMPLATARYLRHTGGAFPVTFKLGSRVMAFEDDVEKWIADQYASTATKAAVRP